MKRLMLATTAAVALSAPAFADTAVEETVMRVLDERGYSAAAAQTLTDAQMTELYLAATSGSNSDISTVIASFDLAGDVDGSLTYATPGASDLNLVVSQTLTSNGFDASMIDKLSVSEMSEIYLASTSEDSNNLNAVLAGLENRETMEMGPAGTSDAEVAVVDYLTDRGYDQSTIDMVDGAEMAAIYIALTSGDDTDVNRAVESAIAS